MSDVAANPTDAAICGLLAAGPLATAALAARLAVPERTARHRLHRLRQAGAVVTGTDGRHRLAAPVPAAPIAGPLPALAAPVTTASTAGALPPLESTATAAGTAGAWPPREGTAVDRAAPVIVPHHPDHDGSSPRPVGGWRPGALLAAIAFGVAAAGGIAIAVAIRGVAPPPPSPPPLSPAPPRPMGFGYPGDPWGGRPW